MFNNRNLNFNGSERGSTALIVALCLIPLVIGILALTVDLNKGQTSYTHNSGAVDAAAYSGAQFVQGAQIKDFEKNNDPNWQTYTPPSADVTNYAWNVYQQNAINDQSAATPIPPGTGADAFSATYTPGSSTTAQGNVVVHACVQTSTPLASAGGMGKKLTECADQTAPLQCTPFTTQSPPNLTHTCTDGTIVSKTVTQKYDCDTHTFLPKVITYFCPPPTCTGSACCPGGICKPTSCETGFSGNGFEFHREGNYRGPYPGSGDLNGGFNQVQDMIKQQIINSGLYANFEVQLLNTEAGNIVYDGIPGGSNIPNPNTNNDIIDSHFPNTSLPGGVYGGHYTVTIPNASSTYQNQNADWESDYCGNGCGGEEDEISASLDVNPSNQTPAAACNGDCPLRTASSSTGDILDQVKSQIQNWPKTYPDIPAAKWAPIINALLNGDGSTSTTSSGQRITNTSGYLNMAWSDINLQSNYIANGICSTFIAINTPCEDDASAIAETYGDWLITYSKTNDKPTPGSGQTYGSPAIYTLTVSKNICADGTAH